MIQVISSKMNLTWFLCVLPAYICLVFAKDSFKAQSLTMVYDLYNATEDEINSHAYALGRPDLFLNPYEVLFNYTLIPTSQPDDPVTVQLLDLDAHNYTKDFFADLFRRCNNANGHNESLKALLKAVDMSLKEGYVYMVSNGETLQDTNLLHEIALKVAEKNIEVEFDSNKRIPADKHTILPKDSVEFHLISVVAKYRKSQRDYSKLERLSNAPKSGFCPPTAPSPTPKIPHASVFIFDVINPTQKDLDNISNIMAENYASRINKRTQFPIIYSYSLDSTTLLDSHKDYTAENFREYISQHNAAANSSTSLVALVNALRLISGNGLNNKIVYFTDNLPNDRYNLILDIMNLLHHSETSVEFEYHTYGALNRPKKIALYELIQRAPKYGERSYH